MVGTIDEVIEKAEKMKAAFKKFYGWRFLQLVVVTPVNQLLSEAVTEVQLSRADGYLGVLPGHAPLITELGIGELTYKTQTDNRAALQFIAASRSLCRSAFSVLAETAERPEDIDVNRAASLEARPGTNRQRRRHRLGIARPRLCSARSCVFRLLSKHQGINIATVR